MAFSGHVASMGLDEVFGFLATNGLEGALTIVGAATLRLYFREGHLLCPYQGPPTRSGRLKRAALDDLLARGAEVRANRPSGKISRSTLDDVFARAEKIQPKRPRPAPDASVSRISKSQLADMVARAEQAAGERRRQATEQLHDAFTWLEARFEFEPGPVPDGIVRDIEAGDVLVFDPTGLLMEVARRADERQRTPVSQQAPSQPLGGKAFEGDLDGVGLAAVLQALRNHRRTGTLSVTARGREEQLFFEDGDVYALRTDEDSDFARFFLGDAVVDDTFDTMTKLSKAALTSPGLVDHTDLTPAELRAVKDRFLDLMFWDGAAFAFFQDKLPVEFHMSTQDGVTRIALDTDKFLLEAIQRLMEWDDIRRELGTGTAIPWFVNMEWKLSAIREHPEAEFLTLIDGHQSFDDLVRVSGAQHLTVGRLLRDLQDRGWLALAQEAPDALAE